MLPVREVSLQGIVVGIARYEDIFSKKHRDAIFLPPARTSESHQPHAQDFFVGVFVCFVLLIVRKIFPVDFLRQESPPPPRLPPSLFSISSCTDRVRV